LERITSKQGRDRWDADRQCKRVCVFGKPPNWDNDCSKEIKRRLDKAMGAIAGFSTIRTDTSA